METEILTTLTGLAGAAKATTEAIRAILTKSKGNREAEKATREALALADDLQTRLLQLQQVALRLQEENAQLRADIRQKEERAADRQKYKRHNLGKAVVLICEEEPDRYYCPACMELKGHPIPLQAHSMHSARIRGGLYCPSCKAGYYRR